MNQRYPDPFYFLCDTTHARYAGLVDRLRGRHESKAPGCELSITLNVAGDRAYIKVTDGNPGWQQAVLSAPWGDPVLEVHDQADQRAFVEGDFATAAWQPEEQVP